MGIGDLYVLLHAAASSLALDAKCFPSGIRPDDTYKLD